MDKDEALRRLAEFEKTIETIQKRASYAIKVDTPIGPQVEIFKLVLDTEVTEIYSFCEAIFGELYRQKYYEPTEPDGTGRSQ